MKGTSNMISRNDLVDHLADLLNVQDFDDYCPNGLQVEGRAEISNIIGGVTASHALIDVAVAQGADALLVHHGYFWKGEDPRVVGMKQSRLKALLDAEINLLAYHLPLDAHPELGNNAQLAALLALKTTGSFGRGSGPDIGLYGELEKPCTAEAFGQHLTEKLGRTPMHIPSDSNGGREIRTIAWCTGAAQGFLEQAAALGVDAFLSGEISEQTVHEARELGIHYFSAGHHATERGGVMALGAHLVDEFRVDFEFVDIPNPV
jgi:dinuclear metal center YbgI/SA1388 family protein